MVMAGRTSTSTDAVVLVPLPALLTVIVCVVVDVPTEFAGVPEITPVEEFNVKPVGKAGATENVFDPNPPVTLTVTGANAEFNVARTCGIAATDNGANGVVLTIADAALLPTSFVATTWNWYAVPFVRPVTVDDVTVEANVDPLVHELAPDSRYCTTYPVAPKVPVGAVQVTVAEPFPAVTAGDPGAFGAVRTVIDNVAVDVYPAASVTVTVCVVAA